MSTVRLSTVRPITVRLSAGRLITGRLTAGSIRVPGRSGRRGWAALIAALAAVGGLLAAAPAHAAAAPVISTVAGGPGGPAPAPRVYLDSPCAVAFAGGQLYLAQQPFGNGLVRAISLKTGGLTTVAGTVGLPPPDGTAPPSPSGHPATGASLGASCGVAVDHAGNLLVADGETFDGTPDGGNNIIRVVAARTGTFYGQAMIKGDIYTIAGDGTGGYSGDGGPATAARLQGPAGLAVDAYGNVITADTGNDVVRVVAAATGTFYGLAMTAGDIYTVAGGAHRRQSGNGGPATRAVLDLEPQNGGEYSGSQPMPAVTLDRHGNIVIADTSSCEVRVVASRPGNFYGQQMKEGYIYRVAGPASGLCDAVSGLGGPALRASFGGLGGVAVDAAGNVIVTDTLSSRVLVIAERTGPFYGRRMTAGDLYSIAGNGHQGSSGDGGPATRSQFAAPLGVTLDSAGNVVVADGTGTENQSFWANARVQVVTARSGRYYGQAMKAGDVYTVAGFPHGDGRQLSGLGGPATRAQLPDGFDATEAQDEASGVAADRSGNLLIPEAIADRLLVVPARTGRAYGQQVTAGHLYSVAGGGTAFPGGGHPAGQARVSDPVAAAIDASGNVLLADYGAHRVAVVAERTGRFYGQRMTAGRIYNLAGNGDYGAAGNGGKATAAAVTPVGVAADQGNVVIGDYPDGDVRLVAETTGRFFGQAMKAGDIYHLAGDGNPGFGPASGAPVVPDSVAVDRAGNVVLADPVTCTIQVIAARTGPFYGQAMIVGHVYTVAGDGQPEPSGDGGPATAAGLDPQAATIDPAGNIVIADAYGLIRVVAVATGMFYGQAMTAGDIYSVAGGGTAGLGDGGPARAAELDFPVAVAVEPSGAIVVGDLSRVRLITP